MNIKLTPKDFVTCDWKVIPVETALPEQHAHAHVDDGRTNYSLPINLDVFGRSTNLPQVENYTDIVDEALAKQSTAVTYSTAGEASDDLLFLSGGSHDGAYGAGYLLGWLEGKESAARSKRVPSAHIRMLPPFALVTGISTGSILATPAFLGDAQQAYDNFNSIDHESDLLDTYGQMSGDNIPLSTFPAILRNGAIADLSPLRKWLSDYLTRDTLERVADRARSATLLVGVVDEESGKAVAIDLTDLATKYAAAVKAKDTARADAARDCYIRSIIASSSAPLAAKPMFINNRTYVDGGVRYGVFTTALEEGVKRGIARRRKSGRRDLPNVFVIFHGTQLVDPWCEAGTASDVCVNPTAVPATARSEWGLLSLVKRSVGLMVNQLQRSSVAQIESKYEPIVGKDHFFSTQIWPELLDFPATLKIDGKDVTKTCQKWYDYDRDVDHPVQFHTHYMKCLTRAGRAQAHADGWPVDERLRLPIPH